jgi:hypothetical protein
MNMKENDKKPRFLMNKAKLAIIPQDDSVSAIGSFSNSC